MSLDLSIYPPRWGVGSEMVEERGYGDLLPVTKCPSAAQSQNLSRSLDVAPEEEQLFPIPSYPHPNPFTSFLPFHNCIAALQPCAYHLHTIS